MGRDGSGKCAYLISGTDGTVTEILTCLKSGITGNLTCLKSGIMKIASQRQGPYSVTTQYVYLNSSAIACTVVSIAIALKGGAVDIGVELRSAGLQNLKKC